MSPQAGASADAPALTALGAPGAQGRCAVTLSAPGSPGCRAAGGWRQSGLWAWAAASLPSPGRWVCRVFLHRLLSARGPHLRLFLPHSPREQGAHSPVSRLHPHCTLSYGGGGLCRPPAARLPPPTAAGCLGGPGAAALQRWVTARTSPAGSAGPAAVLRALGSASGISSSDVTLPSAPPPRRPPRGQSAAAHLLPSRSRVGACLPHSPPLQLAGSLPPQTLTRGGPGTCLRAAPAPTGSDRREARAGLLGEPAPIPPPQL